MKLIKPGLRSNNFFRILLLVFFLIVIFILGAQLKKGQVDLSFLTPAQEGDFPAFPSSSVINFEITSGEKTVLFQRNAQNNNWEPIEKSDLINKWLLAISLQYKETLIKSGLARIKIAVRFNSGSQWEGIWDGQVFVWQTGSLAGRGGVLTPEQQKLFESGLF